MLAQMGALPPVPLAGIHMPIPHLIISVTLMLSLLLSACGGGGDDASRLARLAALAAGAPIAVSTEPETDATGIGNDTTGPGAEMPGAVTDTTATGTDVAGTGTAGASTRTLVAVKAEAPGPGCASGGMRIDAGLDSDGNNALSASEVGSTQYVCAGATDASATLVQMRDEPGSAHCTAGGKAINVGSDGNANGVLEAAETSSTGYVCNGTGASNVAGALNMLASIASEAAGANCAYGGNKVTTGVDSNANGVLDADEVSATQYVCNCAPGAWVGVTDTAVQAQSNTCYIARNDTAQVVVTLPANPAVGDLVRVKGAGSGGWKIAQNAGQAVNAKDLGAVAGVHWMPRDSRRDWRALASSADGSKLVAADADGRIYTSTDSGASWTARESGNRNWYAMASSADGSKLVAAVSFGRIYTSSDSGVNWTARESSRNWYEVASSDDGSKLVAVVRGGYIYTSTDGGASWTERHSPQRWQSVASSADGTKLVAAVEGEQIHTSTDSGVTWTARESHRVWNAVASSADGSKLVAVVFNGPIYTSSDSGVTWQERESNRAWWTVASSADGSKLVAGLTIGYDNPAFISIDSGATWRASETRGSWRLLASSADGSKLVGVLADGSLSTIYTSTASTTPGVGGSISGTSSDTIELQYVGDGMFNVLSHVGSPTVQ
jgi:hypothetical protein